MSEKTPRDEMFNLHHHFSYRFQFNGSELLNTYTVREKPTQFTEDYFYVENKNQEKTLEKIRGAAYHGFHKHIEGFLGKHVTPFEGMSEHDVSFLAFYDNGIVGIEKQRGVITSISRDHKFRGVRFHSIYSHDKKLVEKLEKQLKEECVLETSLDDIFILAAHELVGTKNNIAGEPARFQQMWKDIEAMAKEFYNVDKRTALERISKEK